MSHPGNSVLAGYEPFPGLLPADPYGSHDPHPRDNHSVFSHLDHPLKLAYFGPIIKGGGVLHGNYPNKEIRIGASYCRSPKLPDLSTTLPLPEKALKEISEQFGIPIAVSLPCGRIGPTMMSLDQPYLNMSRLKR